MKKIFGLMLSLGLMLGFSISLFAQTSGGQPMPPNGPEGGQRKGGMQRGPGGQGERGGMRGGEGRGGMRGGRGEGMGGPGGPGGFGMMSEDIYKLNLTDAQKVKLFDLRKQMMQEHEAQMAQMSTKARPTDAEREEMRKLMEAKRFGTLTPDQDAKIKANEAKMKSDMDQRRQKGEAAQQAFLNIFTADQRAQLQKFEEDRRQKRDDMRKNMQQRRQAPGGQPAPSK